MASSSNCGDQVIEEMAEFSELSPRTQRYIARSLAVAFTKPVRIDQWARSVWETSCMMVQLDLYMRLPEARKAVPKSNAYWELADFFRYAVPCAAFDLDERRLDGFAGFKFLYVRLLGASARPWLASLYAAAVALPNCRPDEFYTSDAIWNLEVASGSWVQKEPQFMPEWVPDRDS